MPATLRVVQPQKVPITLNVTAAVKARLRLRPVVTTSPALVFGAVALMPATSGVAAARRSLGSRVFGGMIAATFVAPVFIPLFFTLLARKPRSRHGAPPPNLHPGSGA